MLRSFFLHAQRFLGIAEAVPVIWYGTRCVTKFSITSNHRAAEKWLGKKKLEKLDTVDFQISAPFGTLIDRFIPSRRGSKVFLFGLTFIYKISAYGIYPGIWVSRDIYVPVYISRYMYLYRVICEYRYIYVYIFSTGYQYIYRYVYKFSTGTCTYIYLVPNTSIYTYINLVPVHVNRFIQVQRGSFFVFLPRSFIFRGGR